MDELRRGSRRTAADSVARMAGDVKAACVALDVRLQPLGAGGSGSAQWLQSGGKKSRSGSDPRLGELVVKVGGVWAVCGPRVACGQGIGGSGQRVGCWQRWVRLRGQLVNVSGGRSTALLCADHCAVRTRLPDTPRPAEPPRRCSCIRVRRPARSPSSSPG